MERCEGLLHAFKITTQNELNEPQEFPVHPRRTPAKPEGNTEPPGYQASTHMFLWRSFCRYLLRAPLTTQSFFSVVAFNIEKHQGQTN